MVVGVRDISNIRHFSSSKETITENLGVGLSIG